MAAKVLSSFEDVADSTLRTLRPFLKPVAHICLLSTFVEDGFRMIYQFSEQSKYMNNSWGIGWFFASLFVILNLVVQLGGSALVLARFQTKYAILALTGVVLLQTLAYQALWDIHFFLKNLSVVGGLLLLYAETTTETGRSLFAGLPEANTKDPSSAFQLAGRLLIVLMFLTLVKLNSPVRFIVDIIGLALIPAALVSLIAIGLFTKASAVAIVVLLLIENLTLNAFWMESSTAIRDFRKYDFFQTMSVIGGLLLVVALGPGGHSVDEHKKRW